MLQKACFVIDRSQLKNAEDWLVTDVGSFRDLGMSARVFHIVNRYVPRKVASLSAVKESIWCEMSTTGTTNIVDFLRTATTISDHNGEELQLSLIEYCFTDIHELIRPV